MINYFESSDISIVSALLCYGYQVESIDKENPSKAVFIIKKDNKLEGLIQKYFKHQLQVDALDFFNFLKELKTRLYHT